MCSKYCEGWIQRRTHHEPCLVWPRSSHHALLCSLHQIFWSTVTSKVLFFTFSILDKLVTKISSSAVWAQNLPPNRRERLWENTSPIWRLIVVRSSDGGKICWTIISYHWSIVDLLHNQWESWKLNILRFRQWQQTHPILSSSWLWVGLLVSSMLFRHRCLSFATFFCPCCCFAHLIEFWIEMHFLRWIFHPACKDDVFPRLLPASNPFFSPEPLFEKIFWWATLCSKWYILLWNTVLWHLRILTSRHWFCRSYSHRPLSGQV